MAITKTNTPYEFLVRWTNGAIAGAHVRFLETISEDGTVLTQKEGNAIPVSMAGEAGFPLDELLTLTQQTALADLATAQATASGATAALAAKDAEIASLQAQLAVPPATTGTVTMRQARLALLQAGFYSSVNTAIESMAEPAKTAAKIEWEYANTVERNSAFVASMAAALGLTDTEMDNLFVLAASL